LLKKQKAIQDVIDNFVRLDSDLLSAKNLLELLKVDEDEEMMQELKLQFDQLIVSAKKMELECLFAGEADANDCFLEVHAGAGGVESHDWAEMLMRMYLRFAERDGFVARIVDEVSGEEAGIKSVTMKIEGRNAFGWLRTERGVHRLVRMSPFNSAGKRQTSFAGVWVCPVVDDEIKIEINEKDLRIDTYRASGAGGQHVNKTDSAVRITHLPTKIAVQCQSNRSQHRNRDEAFKMLKAKLYERELEKQDEKLKQDSQAKTDNSWGHQIRSYVLQPYQMVKDHRTNFETSDVEAVLDGELTDMILHNLTRVGKK
jgi:peptide chain release factor 2